MPSLTQVRGLVRFSLSPVLSNLRACVPTAPVVILAVVAPMGEARAASKEDSMVPVSHCYAERNGKSAVCSALDTASMVQDHVSLYNSGTVVQWSISCIRGEWACKRALDG